MSNVAPAPDSPRPSSTRRGSRVVIVGGGPGGYEAALTAARLGASVTLIEERGLGGAAVLTDVVPSKTLIATAEWLTIAERAAHLGLRFAHAATPAAPGMDDVAARAAAPNEAGKAQAGSAQPVANVDLRALNERVRALALEQSADIEATLQRAGVRVLHGRGALLPATGEGGLRTVRATLPDGGYLDCEAEFVLLAVGARPRELPAGRPDGKRILTWAQLYNLEEMPEHLVVIGSGVTGVELASAYQLLGARVTLVSSRPGVLPGQEPEAAALIEQELRERGMQVVTSARAVAVELTEDGEGVAVRLEDGRVLPGSHCLVAVGAVPNTSRLGLENAGVELSPSGHIQVDRVSRTTAFRVYAAGDCTGVLPLASVAAMQGRIAMWHALGDAVAPLDTGDVAATVFTAPEIATVGVQPQQVHEQGLDCFISRLPLPRNPRAKMLGIQTGFLKLVISRRDGLVVGGVIVGPRASELILPVALAVKQHLTAADLAGMINVYPSLSGSIVEAARVVED
ncbi:NAD(P)H-quinone dehydrogenase [Buchananella felis]|uniref:NAD(P)H-quinone dehydrogenase n=1 Tax=Buchananella felis TaxID=3231492 RepID=UPI00352973C2